MERKRIEKLVVLLLIGILMPVSLFPFQVHADTIDTHIRGRNYTYEPITYNEIVLSSTNYYENIGVFHITFELDDEYIGYVLPNYSIQYDNYFYGASSPNWGTLTKTFDRRIFVNGSSFSFDVTVNWNSIYINSAPGGDPFNYDSYTITSSDVTKYADIDSLDQIINILQDLYNSNDQIEGLLNDELTQLQLIVSNTSLANQYLNIISKMRQWNFPIESYNFFCQLYTYQLMDIITYGYYKYPYFQLNTSSSFRSPWMNPNNDNNCILILGVDKSINNMQLFNNYFSSDNIVVKKFEVLNRNDYQNIYSIIKITFDVSSGNYIYFRPKQDVKVMPIYLNNNNNNNSLEFALSFGLSNRLLDNLDIIANGTDQSSSVSESLDQTTSQFSDDASDLVTIEETFNNSMNQSLQNVNPTFNMGSSFLTSANWVSQQFNRIVNNTPFASLITFGLTLGLGLLIIGKVRK